MQRSTLDALVLLSTRLDELKTAQERHTAQSIYACHILWRAIQYIARPSGVLGRRRDRPEENLPEVRMLIPTSTPKTLWERNEETKRLRRLLLDLRYEHARLLDSDYTLLSSNGAKLYEDQIAAVSERMETLAKMKFNVRNEVKNG